MRRPILILAGVILASNPLQCAAGQASPKPNIIVILTDDQGYADLGVHGQVKDIRTPNIDALAAAGVRCTSGYVTAPQCSPSRAGLLSGRYQEKFGLDSIPDGPLPLDEVTIPERLKKAGYVSGMVGKWHLDPNVLCREWARKNLPQVKPDAHGRVQIPPKYLRQYSPLAQGFDECFEGEMQHYFATFDLHGQPLNPQGKELNVPGYRLDTQTRAAWDGSLNLPWLGEKGMLAEGGIHVPFIMCWPGELPAGKVYSPPVSTLDIASTAVALAGLPHDDRLEGMNLMPFLTGQDAGPPHEALYWRFWDQAAVRVGKWKYIQAGNAAKYLFDLTSDEPEKQNLIRQHPEIARSLAGKLSAWTRQLAPPGAPERPLNAQEQKWYQYYFGLPDD